MGQQRRKPEPHWKVKTTTNTLDQTKTVTSKHGTSFTNQDTREQYPCSTVFTCLQ